MRIFIFIVLSYISVESVYAQSASDNIKWGKRKIDSIYIDEVEDGKPTDKVLHAEPLYTDLIRDLGARKGEKEWNLGMGITDNNKYDFYTALLEYEFAPINRLGIEVELPFSFYYPNSGDVKKDSIPASRLNSLKLATQYSFFVSEKFQTSMAIGYIHEVLLTTFTNYNTKKIITGNGYNPFFVAAKRWGANFHTLLYTGPVVHSEHATNKHHSNWQINANIHYMIPGTRNFIGMEIGKQLAKAEHGGNDFDMVLRPQMRVSISDNLQVGIVAGIPVSRENERFSSFIRLIYEPGARHR